MILRNLPIRLLALFSLGFFSSIAASIELEDCRLRASAGAPGLDARCGTLTRPLNPEQPDGQQIELFVAVIAALDLEPASDAFVPIAGGPGQASSEFYAGYANAFEGIRRQRDIVLIDQRGTGQSAPLVCKMEETTNTLRIDHEQTITDTQQCLDSLDYDVRYFTTSIAVQDLEAVREALGYSAFNLYGVSYGSRVAQHYLRQYPDSTRTVILDGVVPPQLILGPDIALDAQTTLSNIFKRCAGNEACQQRFPTLETQFTTLLNTLREEPATLVLADPMSGEVRTVALGELELISAIRMLSYHPSTVALMPLLIDAAANGNLQPMAAQYQIISSSMSEALNTGMHNSVICSEDYPAFSASETQREQLLNTYIGPLLWDQLDAMCSVWPRGIVDPDFNEPVSSNVPVLLLSGSADPVTPPQYAEQAAVNFERATLITVEDQGHGQASVGCMPLIMSDFIEAGSMQDVDSSCIQRAFNMPFFLSFSGPAP